ncbi:MAG: hypothetical protein LC803_10295 [Acidobacteria bacterium]|nr:hypothetical protein [Acidobacteriota bacterium]
MAQPPRYTDSDREADDTDAGLDLVSSAGTPLWVKVFGIIAVVLILLFILLHLTGRGMGGH